MRIILLIMSIVITLVLLIAGCINKQQQREEYAKANNCTWHYNVFNGADIIPEICIKNN